MPDPTGRPIVGDNPRLYAAQQVLAVLRKYQRQYNLPEEWVVASMGIAAQESGFDPRAYNDGCRFHGCGTEDSGGVWQINVKAHPTMTEARFDPTAATEWRVQGLISGWQKAGGLRAFQQNPVAFQQQFHSSVQVSDVPSPQMAQSALQVAQSVIGGANTTVGGGGGPDPESYGAGQPLDTTKTADPPAATDASALQKILSDRAMKILQSPNPDFAELGKLQAAIQISNAVQGKASPDTLAQIAATAGIQDVNNKAEWDRLMFSTGASIGIRREEIAAERDRQNAGFAFTAGQNALDRAQTLAIKTGDWAIANRGLDQDLIRIQNSYQIDLARLGIDREHMDLEKQLGLGQLALGEKRLGLDTQIGMGQLDIARQQLDISKQTNIREEKMAVLRGMVDLLNAQVNAGTLKARTAEKALESLVDIYEKTGGGQEFMEGYEPGGAYATLLSHTGGHYDPQYHRVRAFPLDLVSMAKVGADFDMSKAWQTAQTLMQQAGFSAPPPSGAGTPMAGGTPAQAAPAPQFAPPGPQFQPPAPAPFTGSAPMPPPGPTAPPAAPQSPMAPPDQTAGAPQPTPVSQTTPPTAEAPPTCPVGQLPTWDGRSWSCTR